MPTNISTSANNPGKAGRTRRVALLCAALSAFTLTAGCFKQYPGDPDPDAPRPPRKPPAANSGAAPAPDAARKDGR